MNHEQRNSMVYKLFIPVVVFITGACILALEIIAARILSPYFGNTIYAFSSVISVVLAALSVGYLYGGRLADRNPNEQLFFSLIAAGGAGVLVLQFLVDTVLPILGYILPLTFGPLIASIILFFGPCVILGLLSPFAVKLQSLRMAHYGNGIGTVSGSIFFYSTMGSIVGSLGAGFILIPFVGVTYSVVGIGVVLVLLGLVSLIPHKPRSSVVSAVVIITVLSIVSTIVIAMNRPESVFSADGVYEKIIIRDSEYNGKPARFFLQDRSNSGAMHLLPEHADELVFEYTKYYEIYKAFRPTASRSLVIGGGAYSIPKKMLQEEGTTVVDVAEIEPSLFELAQKYFAVPNDSRLKNHVVDGRRFLHDAKEPYDMIFSDVYYSLYSIPSHLTTKEFFITAKEKLSKNGVFIANIIGNLGDTTEPTLVFSEMKTFLDVFPNSHFFAVQSPHLSNTQNIIFVGVNGDAQFDSSVLPQFYGKYIDVSDIDLSNQYVLTDDFAPVEYLTRKVLVGNNSSETKEEVALEGKRILQRIRDQVALGPRHLSAKGRTDVQEYIKQELSGAVDAVVIQKWDHPLSQGGNVPLTNIIGRTDIDNPRRIIVATHYDTKRFAEHDADKKKYVPGANDGASGVALLLEIAHTLKSQKNQASPRVGIDFVFFDGEEGEDHLVNNYKDWLPLGSTYFAKNISGVYSHVKPEQAIVADMVCEKGAVFKPENNSLRFAPKQTAEFWHIATAISPDFFSSDNQGAIVDDHMPLNAAGIPSFLIIDLDYPFFHTSKDTPDKCDEATLSAVNTALLRYIYKL